MIKIWFQIIRTVKTRIDVSNIVFYKLLKSIVLRVGKINKYTCIHITIVSLQLFYFSYFTFVLASKLLYIMETPIEYIIVIDKWVQKKTVVFNQCNEIKQYSLGNRIFTFKIALV